MLKLQPSLPQNLVNIKSRNESDYWSPAVEEGSEETGKPVVLMKFVIWCGEWLSTPDTKEADLTSRQRDPESGL